METTKRQTELRMAVWLQVKFLGCGLGPHARSVCDTKAPLQLQYAACGSILVFYTFALLTKGG